ncbi:hypothetical protein NOR51B_1135 [Luminiphilus syltensis NOR5-1B]|uniref:Lipoprotein SmpA/OmlA domain-containing protein n=1 Tax=Luminiphilus syltensis NOR5-1B TaxID=565045 RepID=B8KV95_9GAMM|nr:outer membrane protein assembly factor BamE [Luminiphilus syltensis]EED35190.1 hypothetical protein NOR51B_1135 [Luminiphilus syltensis NOR5-1B]
MVLDRYYPACRWLTATALTLVLMGCAQYDSERGVDVAWQPETLAQFQVGKTTRTDVMATLGPPSQVVNLGDETLLYYLNERAEGNGLILLVYNRFEIDTRYDRAVFIFGADGLLEDFSGHIADVNE